MPDPVQDATNVINDRMQTGFLNPVTNSDIKDVVREMTALSGPDADRMVDNLAASGQLDRIADEVMDGSILGLGGLSASERQAFFADLAGKLDGQSLAALSNAFARTDGNSGGFTPVNELADAVGVHAGPQAKLDYIGAMMPGVADGSYTDVGFGYSATHFSDAEAAAVGQVLGTMRGSYAEAAFNRIGTHLPDVLSSSIGASMMSTASMAGSSNTMTWSAENYEAIMGAAASMGNADLKARVFDAGVATMREVRDTNSIIGGLTVFGKDAAMDAMADGLTAIIDSDTTGVMRELAFNAETLDGSAFAAYAKEMLSQDREAELGAQMGRLQVGNNGTENAVTRLDQVTTVPGTNQQRRENAGALGYYIGGVYAATQAISSDVAEQRAMVTALLKSALSVVDKARVGGPAAAGVGTAASVAKEWVQFAVNAAIADEGTAAGIRLERAALPIDGATGELGVGDNVVSAFEDKLASVTRTARP